MKHFILATALSILFSIGAWAGDERCDELRLNYLQSYQDVQEEFESLEYALLVAASDFENVVTALLRLDGAGDLAARLFSTEQHRVYQLRFRIFEVIQYEREFARAAHALRNGIPNGGRGWYKSETCVFDPFLFFRYADRLSQKMEAVDEISARYNQLLMNISRFASNPVAEGKIISPRASELISVRGITRDESLGLIAP
jgi:hypothetical protein